MIGAWGVGKKPARAARFFLRTHTDTDTDTDADADTDTDTDTDADTDTDTARIRRQKKQQLIPIASPNTTPKPETTAPKRQTIQTSPSQLLYKKPVTTKVLNSPSQQTNKTHELNLSAQLEQKSQIHRTNFQSNASTYSKTILA